MAGYLLDTTAMIDYLRGQKEVISLLEELTIKGHHLGCSPINVVEIYAGLKEKERKLAKELIENLTYFETTLEIAKKAGEYQFQYARQGKPLSTPDVIIAATAIVNNITLLTANIKDFPMPELKAIEVP